MPAITASLSRPSSVVARTGAPWPDLPERFGTYDSVYQRFNRWAKKGRWPAIFEALLEKIAAWEAEAVIPGKKNRSESDTL